MIDWFVNSKSKPKKPTSDNLFNLIGMPSFKSNKVKSHKDPLISLFKGQGNPNPLDRKPKSQKRFLNKTKLGSGKSHKRFWDTDGDGVIDGLDCYYKNPKRHGTDFRYNQPTYDESKIKQTVRDIGEVDECGNSLGNCLKISNEIQKQIPNSRVISVTPLVDRGAQHRALSTPDKKVIDTQTWQYHERKPTDLDTRQVEFDRDEYKKRFIMEDEEGDKI